ncbi:Protein W02A2.5, partial [Aphelenchoides avenae]
MGDNTTYIGKIRVVFANSPPAVYDECVRFPVLTPSPKCPYPGYAAEIIGLVAKSLNMKVEPIVMTRKLGDVDWGSFDNGSWSGMLGLVANGTADTMSFVFNETPLRKEYFQMSQSPFSSKMNFAVRRHETVGDHMWDLFRSYSMSTWLTVLAVFALQTVYCIGVAKAEVGMRRRAAADPLNTIWKMVRLQLLQAEYEEFHTTAGNFSMMIFMMFQCVIVLALYQTWILSSILRPLKAEPFTSEELIPMIVQGRYRFVTHSDGYWYYEAIEQSNETQFRQLRQATISYPIVRTASVDETLDYVLNKNGLMVTDEVDYGRITFADKCNVVFVSGEEKTTHFIFRKGNRLNYLFDRAIEQEMLRIKRIMERYRDIERSVRLKHCPVDDPNAPKFRPL